MAFAITAVSGAGERESIFEDSDRFDEESLDSCTSEQDSSLNNWRGWNSTSNPIARLNLDLSKNYGICLLFVLYSGLMSFRARLSEEFVCNFTQIISVFCWHWDPLSNSCAWLLFLFIRHVFTGNPFGAVCEAGGRMFPIRSHWEVLRAHSVRRPTSNFVLEFSNINS